MHQARHDEAKGLLFDHLAGLPSTAERPPSKCLPRSSTPPDSVRLPRYQSPSLGPLSLLASPPPQFFQCSVHLCVMVLDLTGLTTRRRFELLDRLGSPICDLPLSLSRRVYL